MARFWWRWTYIIWCYGLIIAAFWENVLADKNILYRTSSLCGRKYTQQLYKKTDGAVLVSKNEYNLDCLITFQTDSVLQKFMLRFEQLQLDCKDHLYIYDGDYTYSTNFKSNLSCRNNHHEFGLMYTRTNFVTLKYVTDEWHQAGSGFQLVLTAFKDSSYECRAFRCNNNLCIHEDLKCDHINHCGDNSDESSTQASCLDTVMDKIHGMGVGVAIIIIVSAFLTCFGCVAVIALLIYKLHRRRPPTLNHLNTTTTYPFLPAKVPEESACSEKTQVNTMNSVSVFHSAAGIPTGAPGEAPTIPGKPLSPSGRDGVQCSPGKHLLPNKMKSGSRSQKKCNNTRREKGEWLV